MEKIISKKYFRFIILIFICLFFILTYHFFDINQINSLVNIDQSDNQYFSFYIPFVVFILRFISILIPILPGTYCSVIAGYFYGIPLGLFIIFWADFISCSSSFYISRNYGKGFVGKLLGVKQMRRIEHFGDKYLENNIYLMTGFLMTSWFDFVCYAVGFTKLPWRKFLPSLIISIIISDIPFVAGGFSLKGLQNIGIEQILNGDIQVLQVPYIILLVTSAFIIFGLGILKACLSNRLNQDTN